MRDALRETSGDGSPRQTLEALLAQGSTGTARTEVAPKRQATLPITRPSSSNAEVPIPAPARSGPLVLMAGGTTGQPIASEALGQPAGSKVTRAVALAIGLALLAAAGAVVALRARGRESPAGPTTQAAVQSSPVIEPPVPSTLASTITGSATSRTTVSAPTATSTLRTLPPIPPAPATSARPSASPRVPAATVAPSPTVNCTPPYYFDAKGLKVFKKECL